MLKRIKISVAAVVGVASLWAAVAATSHTSGVEPHTASNLTASDAYTLVASHSFLSGFAPTAGDGAVNVVVEIPTGRVDKWEVDKNDGSLRWEFKNGAPRRVNYIGYPGNYGMVPRTLLASDAGGDGDPLDVLVLGPAVTRGTVVRAHLIGVLRMLDGGEHDDKLLAVLEGTALEQVENIEQLQAAFPGVTTIVETWFANYKGAGVIETAGFGDVDEARAILETAVQTYAAKHADF